MDIQYGKLENLNWLWLVLAIAVVVLVAIAMHRRAISQFASPNLLQHMIRSSGYSKSITSIMLTVLALVFVVIALVDIRWGKVWREVPQRGIEVIFALDISRSMLAEDAAPNRLSRAKQNIRDMIGEMSGDRIGLILFAGDVRRYVPLTNHYEDFKQSLDEVGPHNIDRGGSNLGEAISVAAESFLEKTSNHKAIVLFTDGEDHESDPVNAAKKAFEDWGARIFTVGLGDFERGSRIPVQNGAQRQSFVQHDGEQVWSKMDGKILKEVAAVSEGAYIPAGTKRVDMAAVYHRFIGGIDHQEFDTARINAYVPRYPLFLGVALALLLLEVLLSTWPQRVAQPVTSIDEFAKGAA